MSKTKLCEQPYLIWLKRIKTCEGAGLKGLQVQGAQSGMQKENRTPILIFNALLLFEGVFVHVCSLKVYMYVSTQVHVVDVCSSRWSHSP